MQIHALWDDDKVNAATRQVGDEWQVLMFGGMARHPEVTEDAFTLVACHELGHHLAGAPKYQVINRRTFRVENDWSSSEGQADYWGAIHCLKKLLAAEDNVAKMQDVKVSFQVKAKCRQEHSGPQEQALCMRIALAGKSVSRIFAASRGSRIPPLFSTPMKRKVAETFAGHPDPQCRPRYLFSGCFM